MGVGWEHDAPGYPAVMTAEGTGDPDRRSDFEVIRDSLLRMDPETRAEVVATMRALRALPPLAAVRVLAKAAVPPRGPLITFGP